MIEKLHIGFNDIENEKIYKLNLTEKQKKALGFNTNKNTVWDFLDTYLADKKLKEYLHDEFLNTIHKTLPKEIINSCKYCTGNDKSVLEEDRKCYNYFKEGQMNEFFALYWFINIVENNKHLLTDNKAIKNLSIKFYECFLFKNGRVFFDLRKLTMHTLEQGFLTLSKVFAQNDKINSLEIINQTIDSLDSQYLSITMFEKTEPYHIEPQKIFFKNKRKSIKEQIKIEKLKEKQNPPQQTETNILIKLEKEIETISKQMSIFKSIESKEINVCVISKTEIFDVNLLDNYLLNQTKNQYLDARLTDLKNLCEKVKKSNENKIDASNKETLFKYEFKRTNKKTNDPECYKFSSFNESIFLLNTAELKYKKIDFNEAENHYKNGYFAKSFTKGLLALKCNEILEVLNKYLTQQPKAKEKKILEQKLNYNSSQFNKYTFDLFCYILGEYKKEGNIKYINIWYFLKRDIKNKDKILFNFTQKEYKEYVRKYNIEIKKFQKAEFKYEDDEKRILQNIVDTYTQNLI